jgi:Family of unknown function (DUF6527)
VGSSVTSWPVLVTDADGFDRWRAELPHGGAFRAAVQAKIAATGETLLCWFGPDPAAPVSFQWMCPGCGSTYSGQLGSEPVSGWDAPRWVNSGTREKPALTPSLGCGLWRRRECIGHWWLRDGELVLA